MGATDPRLPPRWLAVACLLALSMAARAEDRATAGLFIHTDDDGLRVIHPTATMAASLDEDDRVSLHYEADVVSAATVDVRTSASPRGFEETRHGISASVERDLRRTLRLGGSYGFSHTPDHSSHSAALRLAREDEGRDREVAASVGWAWDEIRRAEVDDVAGHAVSARLGLSFATLLSSVSVLDVAAALERQSGFLESAYRVVPLESATGQDMVWVAETVPDTRWRSAVRTRLRLALRNDLFLNLSVRLHGDTWGVLGQTTEAALTAELRPRVRLTGHARFYGQRGASFYRGRYQTFPEVPDRRTRDRELARSLQGAGGLRLALTLAKFDDVRLGLDLRSELTGYRYFDTPVLPRRRALTLGAVLTLER